MINSSQEIFGEPDIDIITCEKFTFPIIQKEEIETKLRRSACRASGFDDLNARFINIFALLLPKTLWLLFNKSLNEGFFPDLWKISNIIPIFKSGDKKYNE
jgi:hypothetical protein